MVLSAFFAPRVEDLRNHFGLYFVRYFGVFCSASAVSAARFGQLKATFCFLSPEHMLASGDFLWVKKIITLRRFRDS